MEVGLPKEVRLVSPQTLEAVRKRDGYCAYGLLAKDGCSGGLDIHHIDTKGSGGDDDPRNLITLCRRHHMMAQERRISAQTLRDILTHFFNYIYGD